MLALKVERTGHQFVDSACKDAGKGHGAPPEPSSAAAATVPAVGGPGAMTVEAWAAAARTDLPRLRVMPRSRSTPLRLEEHAIIEGAKAWRC